MTAVKIPPLNLYSYREVAYLLTRFPLFLHADDEAVEQVLRYQYAAPEKNLEMQYNQSNTRDNSNYNGRIV